MKQKYLKIFNCVLSGALFMSLAACHSAAKTETLSAAEINSNAATAPVEKMDKDNTASKRSAGKIIPSSMTGTYEFSDYKDGRGSITRMIISRAQEEGMQISIFGNYLFPNGEITSVFSTATDGYAEIKGQKLLVELTDDHDKRCTANVSFAAGAATLKASPKCSFKPNLEHTYKKISPKTLIKIDNPEIIARYAEIPFAALEKHVNYSDEDADSFRLTTGEHFIIKDVPVSRIGGADNGEKYSSPLDWQPLVSASEETEGGAAVALLVSADTAKRLKAVDLNSASSMRMTAVLISVFSSHDVYRTNYVSKVEGLNENGEVIWTVSGSEPSKIVLND